MANGICEIRVSRICKRNTLICVSFTIIALLGYISYFAFADREENTLQLTFVIFRHGDRTPTETYKNDPYINYSWPDGWGSLTNKGKQQLFELGQTLHKRYKNIIEDEHFSVSDVLVRSSYADRCIMSASTLLAGMFPPNPKQVWNTDLMWQPVPIHPIPRSDDNLIAMKKKCDAYDLALAQAYKSDRIQKLNKENEKLLKYLTDHTGQNISDITALEFLYNTLEIEQNAGLELPEWTKKVYPGNMRELAAKSLAIFTDTVFMRRMKGGVIIKEMIELAEKKRANNLKKKMYLYSAHDISLVNILRPLGFLNDLKPDYGAALVLEVHTAILNDLEIKMYYYENAWATDYRVLKLDSCPEPCLLSDFKAALAPIIPDDWEEECKI